MTRSYRLRKEAWEDLVTSTNWYEERSMVAATGLLKEFEASHSTILQYPNGFVELGSGLRQCVFKRFPFVVVYTMHGTACHVVAVFHTSRNPEDKLK